MRMHAIECKTAREAIQKAASMPGHVAILVQGKRLVVPAGRVDQLKVLGTSFALLCGHKGTIVTVPING
jgi:hypothetical protein